MDRPITVQLSGQEARLLFNTIQARSRYQPIKHPYGRVVWQPWMGVLLKKLSQALGEAGVEGAANQIRWRGRSDTGQEKEGGQ